jgi:pyrroline-5-carboxylate reductase
MKLGFVGTGAITEAIVTGTLRSSLAISDISVSPRSADVAARLAAKDKRVMIAASNQAVVDASDIVFLAIRPQVAEEVVPPLRFRSGQSVISVIAATERAVLERWINQTVKLTQAIPLPFVADCDGVTAIYPRDEETAAIFSALGTAVECDTKEEYDLLAVASALMGTYFGVLDKTAGWLVDHGMRAETAKAYLAPLFTRLSQTAVQSANQSFSQLRLEFSTKGGLNEQVFEDFDQKGGTKALLDALDRVHHRVRG